MTGKLISRIIGLVVAIGVGLAVFFNLLNAPNIHLGTAATAGIAVLSALVALILSIWIALVPYRWVRDQIRRAEVSDVIAAVIGLIVGLIIAALASIFLSQITFLGLGHWLPTLTAILFAYVGITIAVLRKDDFGRLFASAATAGRAARRAAREERDNDESEDRDDHAREDHAPLRHRLPGRDRKSPRLNSSHTVISYAGFCFE